MRQALTIMAVITAALLLVSGVIVVGSMEQSNQINSQRAQLSELRQRLQDANARLDEQAASAGLLTASLAAARRERDEVLEALSEAELAVTGSSQALIDAQQSHEAERLAWNDRLAEQTSRADALSFELQALMGERNADALVIKELKETLEAFEASHIQNEPHPPEGEAQPDDEPDIELSVPAPVVDAVPTPVASPTPALLH